ncbi:MAG: fumarylacetoacetate hydrolase family protein, partial [Deltaproteobacteria bacterium]|nr:fumarylacetoacetate hydrolase family protein [Deltaproteobacteria bacterium]
FVTKDELEPYRTASKVGNQYDLEMKAFHNGKQVSSGTTKDMNWTFAQIIERCSYGTFLYPGDVIGSGTVGSGCYYENNFICEKQTWLYVGDTIELEVTGLGRLKNEIVTS